MGADLLRELADDPKEEEYAAEGHEFLERERRGCDERGGEGEQSEPCQKKYFLGRMTDRARYDARRGTKGESSRLARTYRVLHPRRHLRRATFARGPSSRVPRPDRLRGSRARA